jgi:hypothetical protein
VVLLLTHILLGLFLAVASPGSDVLTKISEPPCLTADSHRCKPVVTFVTPTKGRSTLNRTVESLLNQTNPRWKSIVVFDNVTAPALPAAAELDSRFNLMALQHKVGQGNNSAGIVRNLAMFKVTTQWVAFVDDDDTLAPEYVEWLIEEHKLDRSLDVIIFRMHQLNPDIADRVLPPNTDMTFHPGRVGISFAMRANLFREGFRFNPHSGEDFILLNRLRRAGKKLLIAPRIGYYVRHTAEEYPTMRSLQFRRVLVWPVPCDYTYVQPPACMADELMCPCAPHEVDRTLPEMPLWAKIMLALVILLMIILPFFVLCFIIYVGWRDDRARARASSATGSERQV